MSLAIPVLKRSNSKLTTSHAVSSDTADDNGSMYRVDSMVFESVEIPRTMLPPAIRVSLATASIRSSCNSQSPTLCRESSVMSLPRQPSLPDEKDLPATPTNMTSRSNLESASQPVKKKNTLARTLFFSGFLFPLLWAFGGALIWHRTAYARTDLTASCKPRYHHTQPTIDIQPECEKNNSLMATLSPNATVFVHLPYHGDNWAWACLWAFALFLVAASIVLIALYANNTI